MMNELRDASCYPKILVGVDLALACIDGGISAFAFYQLMRIQARNSHLGWTRQKVFHLIIGSSNMGYLVYFVLTLIAACKDWACWSHSCGFIVMACPKILFLAAFLLLLSFWVDLCHQANDEEDEDEDEECGPQEALLERASNKSHSNADSHRRFCSFRAIHVESRQKVVILVTAVIFVIMITSAVLIWIGMGRNPIDSDMVARVYVDLFSVAILLLGGALACYGLLLFSKMREVRSERANSETWKVAGLAVVSVLCFTSSALVALFTDIPMLYYWHHQHVNGVYTSLLLILYYFIGSSVPSAYVLWVMRELPPSIAVNVVEESMTIAFIHGSSVTINPQSWTAAASSQNQISRASPI
ncbi:Tobamovirus multiplication protein like [Actinidia chinensis var. chinensis]|uniref:Tobamovirus multiplication protein like n=1 Tax=Actinidia chinensis var. chinensis TaxID=1590841 RepID=A0A2R6QAH0_ACTCC|nr:Tobamovirus multiplication protein like [Actinidia chinensis var. chinensis]